MDVFHPQFELFVFKYDRLWFGLRFLRSNRRRGKNQDTDYALRYPHATLPISELSTFGDIDVSTKPRQANSVTLTRTRTSLRLAL